jgi:adenosylcobinamide-GDP ribazoletransferase
MKPFFAALQFLTIIPLPRGLSGDHKALSRSVTFFPIIGLMIGVTAAALDAALNAVLPQFPATVLVVIYLTAISGGLHMDGLADTADGFFSARPRAKILDIMRDSHIGAMGVMAVVSVLLLKVSLLVSIPSSLRMQTIILMPVAGRCALTMLLTILPYVRQEGGLATLFQETRSWRQLPWIVFFLILTGWITTQWTGVFSAIFSLFIMLSFAAYSHYKIGGFTGDTLGAACEITELAPVIAMLISLRIGLITW